MIVSLLLVLFSVYAEENKQRERERERRRKGERERNSTNNTYATGMNKNIYFDYLLYERYVCYLYFIPMTEKDKNFSSDNISVESLEDGDQLTHFMSHDHISEQYFINQFYCHNSSDSNSTRNFPSSSSTRYSSISSMKCIVRKYHIILSESPYSF